MTGVNDLTFEGRSGVECEAFIRAIRKSAFSVGKIDNPKWTAQFASTFFAGDALRWHVTLKPEVKRDWDELEQAMLLEYPKGSSSLPPTPCGPSVPCEEPHILTSRM